MDLDHVVVPVVGLAAYIYLEVRPSLGKHWLQTLAWRLKSPRERIRLLEADLAESTTVRNRLALAEELHSAGQFDRECAVLGEGLRGTFKDDATLLMHLAEAHSGSRPHVPGGPKTLIKASRARKIARFAASVWNLAQGTSRGAREGRKCRGGNDSYKG